MMDIGNQHQLPNEASGNIQELQEARSFLQAILKTTYYGIASYEPIRDGNKKITDFKIKYSNAEVPKNFGLQIEDVIGKMCSEVYPGIFKNGVFEKLVACAESGESANYDVAIKNKSDTVWLSANVEMVNNMVTVTSRNTTDEKNAALHLTAMNKLLDNKNKELEKQIFTDFSTSFASYKSGSEFFDFVIQELYAKTKMDYILLGEMFENESEKEIHTFSICAFGEIVDNISYSITDTPCNAVIKGKIVSQTNNTKNSYSNTLLSKNNIEGYIGLPLMDSQGKCIGILSVAHQTEIIDNEHITTLLKIAGKRCEMELEKQVRERLMTDKNEELELKNKELESFNYIASHDLQEPLRKIQLFYSRIMEKDSAVLSEESKGYFSNIGSAATRMQNLIQALLSYSTASQNETAYEKVDLNKLLVEVKGNLSDMITEKNASIISDNLPKVSVIPVQFKQVLLNLLSNGIKYAKHDVAPIIKITSEVINSEISKGRKYTKISFSDNGIGFEQQYEHKIFELFQRLHGKNEYMGTGIGLAICKKIIDNHKGFIKVTSEVGVGSVFSIYLPTKK